MVIRLLVFSTIVSVVWGVPIKIETDARSIGQKIAAYAITCAAVVWVTATIAAGVVMSLNHADEIKPLREENHRLEGVLGKMGMDVQYKILDVQKLKP